MSIPAIVEPIKKEDSKPSLSKNASSKSKQNTSKAPEPEPEAIIESVESEEEIEYIPAFEANDYMEKAEMSPPQDPNGN